ncbi:MAG TPA: cysteine desulfurase family protein [Candidatus Paceibacterota bacterium]|nr:cysteine desulfurase family protein [Candidatus Paceibacterota bacterium]
MGINFSWFQKNPTHGTSKRVFLDYASATPVSKRVSRVLETYQGYFHNPAAIYTEGVKAKEIIKDARVQIAKIVSAQPNEIYFTSGGTESANLAIQGVIKALDRTVFPRPHIIVSAFEHAAVLETTRALEADGVLITYVLPNDDGIIDPKEISKLLTPDTVLVCVMYVNNEIGTIQPLREISKKIKEMRKSVSGRDQHSDYPYFYTDACQAPLYLPLAINELGVDMVTLDGIKMYGPRASGILIAKDAVRFAPLMLGGAHQRGKRPGTESVSQVVGIKEALIEATELRVSESERIRKLQTYFIEKIARHYGEKASINGSVKEGELIPNNVNVCIRNIDSEFVVLQLDAKGICVSSASSCSTLSDAAGSYVIESLGEAKRRCAESSIRFSFGRETTKKDIDIALETLFKIV